MRPTLRLVVAVLAAIQPVTLRAESMDEAAAKEARRRAQARANGVHPTYTNQDLESRGEVSGSQYGSRATDPGVAPSPSPARAARTPLDGTSDQRRVSEASWRNWAQDAHDRLERAREAYDAVKDQWRNPTAGCSLTSLRARIDRAKAELAAAQKGLDDLEETARHAGVPPGWMR